VSWTQAKADLRAKVASLAGLHLKAVSWNDQPDASANKIVKLDVIAAKQELPDRRVKTMNETTGDYDVEVSTLMGFTVSIRCEDIKGECLEIAEAIRSGLGWKSTADDLHTKGIAVVDMPGSITPVPVLLDERMKNAALFDVIFRAEFNRPDPVAQSTIEHVEAEGELNTGEPPPVTVSIDVDR
jgi:hypothetical protein